MFCEAGIDLQTIETMLELSKFEEQVKFKLKGEIEKYNDNFKGLVCIYKLLDLETNDTTKTQPKVDLEYIVPHDYKCKFAKE